MDDFFAYLSIGLVILWIVLLVLAYGGSDKSKLRERFWRGNMLIIVAITLWRVALYEFFWIPSSSMEPTLREWEVIAVDKRSYGVRMPISGERITNGRDPQRGEIAVFRFPGNESTFYIKRIMALPGESFSFAGDRITIADSLVTLAGPGQTSYGYSKPLFGGEPTQEGEVYWEKLEDGWHSVLLADDQAHLQRYRQSDGCSVQRDESNLWRLNCVVPPDHYFVMGDNRHRSNDSRFWGFVPRENLVGAAVRRLVSASGFGRWGDSLALTADPMNIEQIEPLPAQCWSMLEPVPAAAATEQDQDEQVDDALEELHALCKPHLDRIFPYLLVPAAS